MKTSRLHQRILRTGIDAHKPGIWQLTNKNSDIHSRRKVVYNFTPINTLQKFSLENGDPPQSHVSTQIQSLSIRRLRFRILDRHFNIPL